MLAADEPKILETKSDLFAQFKAGDVLVINTTKVSPRRVFTDQELEVLFVSGNHDLRGMVSRLTEAVNWPGVDADAESAGL